MRLELVRFASLSEGLWEELLAHSVHRSIFHNPKWIRLWERAYPWARSWATLVIDSQGIQATLPAVEFQRGPFSNFYSLPYGTYGGPIYKQGGAEPVKVLLKTFASLKGSGERVVTDFYGDCSDLLNFGFKVSTHTTQILELSQGLERIWQGMTPAKRRLVRQAERLGVRVALVRPEEIEICYRMDEDTARYHHCRPRFDLRFYKHLYTELSPACMLYWVMARLNGEPLAHMINLCYGKELFYWQGGSFRSRLGYRPNEALIWDTIRWGISRAFSTYNLGASPTSGVAKFKAGWGAKELSYQVYYRDCRLLNFLRTLRRT